MCAGGVRTERGARKSRTPRANHNTHQATVKAVRRSGGNAGGGVSGGNEGGGELVCEREKAGRFRTAVGVRVAALTTGAEVDGPQQTPSTSPPQKYQVRSILREFWRNHPAFSTFSSLFCCLDLFYSSHHLLFRQLKKKKGGEGRRRRKEQ